MASRILDSMTCQNIHIDNVKVNGFAERKSNFNGKLDYVFAVEVQWSDGRMCCVKRTYAEFITLCENLTKVLKCANENGLTNRHLAIPRLKGCKWYIKYDRCLAESREEELHNFAQNLLRQNPSVSEHPAVLDFFEQRPSDPVPGHPRHHISPHHYLYQVSNHFECCLL
ncbi:hypothetical protein LOTGIDRAFT_162077 [Lottia gigantea]|uniref:PX domain-containing protein n=1 Tax=Lottia gigantea TaxID=225164 RepID=V4A8I5_LOTGI|nr:hypothetical protein LOTGIDRAFT_162077 [Lottia gigantea]ESO93052.1 hypothetical protein LOTGIDRAFT_162077 [Lottia gigantea]